MKIAEIYLKQKNKRLDKAYYYKIDDNLIKAVLPGMRVVVGFGRGNRQLEGFVCKLLEVDSLPYPVKPVKSLIDEEPILNEGQIELLIWMKNYYAALFYDCLANFTGAVSVKQETALILDQEKSQYNHEQTAFVLKYFNEKKDFVFEAAIEKEDQQLLDKLINQGIIKRQAFFKKRKTATQKRYLLNKDANSDSKGLGLNQQRILKLLEYKSLTDSELKQMFPNYRSSIKSLLKKNLVSETIEKVNLTISEKKGQKLFRKVVITAEEEVLYFNYEKGLKERNGSFLQVNDPVSKFRLLFKIIEEKILAGESVLLLFPEINLTYHRWELFYKYFGERMGLYHHKLSSKEQGKMWQDVKSGQIQLIIGVQSALFLPFKNLGLMIVENESDPIYYTLGSPKFHLVDLVEAYAKILGGQYLLVDEIPRVRTWYQYQQGQISFLRTGQVRNSGNLKIVDMQQEIKSGNLSLISRELHQAIRNSLLNRQLTVILANRTGYSSAILCRSCGQVQKCPHCGVALTYQEQKHSLSCRYCGYQQKNAHLCSCCKSNQLRHLGMGIRQLEDYFKKTYPNAVIKSVMGGMSFTQIREINEALKNGQIDILLGTQAINKHFDLSRARVAASFLIDRDLNLGDYDSAEMTYLIYSRFFKKALRAEGKGFIQTSDPENDMVVSIAENDFESFYQGEGSFRQMLKYPPFYFMVEFKLIHAQREVLDNDALRLYILLEEYLKKADLEEYYLYKPVYLGRADKERLEEQLILKLKEIDSFQMIYQKIIENGELEVIKSRISLHIKN